MTTDSLFENLDGQTPLTEDERLDLRPSLSTRGELNEAERLNINTARIWAMRPAVLRRPDLLTDHFGRDLHRRMFKEVWNWAGRYRASERNLGWEPHRIPEGVRLALDNTRFWLEQNTYPLHECAIRLHHQLVLIHPWINGNGRQARLLADIIVASRSGSPLTWGARADLATPGSARSRYITAVKKADQGDFDELLRFSLA